VKNFRRSLLMNVALMLVAAVVAWLYALGVGLPWVDWARYLLAGYFLIQGFIASVDYWRLGFTNGAADNASGAGCGPTQATPPIAMTGAKSPPGVPAAYESGPRKNLNRAMPSRSSVAGWLARIVCVMSSPPPIQSGANQPAVPTTNPITAAFAGTGIPRNFSESASKPSRSRL